MRRYGWTTQEYKRENLNNIFEYQMLINAEQESMMEDMKSTKDVFGKMLILLIYKYG